MSTSPNPLDPHDPAHAAGTSPPPLLAAAGPHRLAALEAERRRIERVVAELASNELDQRTEEEDLGEVATASQHPADVASETLEREVELGLLDDFRTALAEVDAAVRRVADGSYGTCERCRQRIGDERLQAVPATRWCVVCAEAVERSASWRGSGPGRTGGLASDEFLAHDDEPDPPVDRDLSGEESALTVRDLLGADRPG